MAWLLHIFNLAYQLNCFLWTYSSKVWYQTFVKATDAPFISHYLTEAVNRSCISPTWCLKSGFDHVYWKDAWCTECPSHCADSKLDWYRELLGLLLHCGNLMFLHFPTYTMVLTSFQLRHLRSTWGTQAVDRLSSHPIERWEIWWQFFIFCFYVHDGPGRPTTDQSSQINAASTGIPTFSRHLRENDSLF